LVVVAVAHKPEVLAAQVDPEVVAQVAEARWPHLEEQLVHRVKVMLAATHSMRDQVVPLIF
jgi:hypothetical protein